MGNIPTRFVDQAVMDCVERQFEAVGDTELVKDVVQVILYGLLADEELFSDSFVLKAPSDELDNFQLAVAEERLFFTRTGFGRCRKGIDDFGGHAAIERNFTSMHAMYAFYEEIDGGFFKDYASRTQPHGANHVTVIFGSGEDDDTSREHIEIYFLKNSKTVLLGHMKIEEQNVRF